MVAAVIVYCTRAPRPRSQHLPTPNYGDGPLDTHDFPYRLDPIERGDCIRFGYRFGSGMKNPVCSTNENETSIAIVFGESVLKKADDFRYGRVFDATRVSIVPVTTMVRQNERAKIVMSIRNFRPTGNAGWPFHHSNSVRPEHGNPRVEFRFLRAETRLLHGPLTFVFPNL